MTKKAGDGIIRRDTLLKWTRTLAMQTLELRIRALVGSTKDTVSIISCLSTCL